EKFGINEIIITTMQALSGAGFPGVPALQIQGNIIPFIKNEEEKVENEPLKILGKLKEGRIENAKFKISATCIRVPVVDSHTISLYIKTKKDVTTTEVKKTLADFSGLPQKLKLPSAPKQPIIVREEEDRPQPILDKNAGNGMSVVVGRIRTKKKLISLVLLSHNTIRGAAGAGILDAELLMKLGIIKK
ncbi:MAG: aspartate-semialdehyde dehydrogenase, partial [Candidatus Altiarchaeota archaeon]